MRYHEFKLIEDADETDDARAGRTNASDTPPAGTVQNTEIAADRLPSENGVPFANNFLRSLLGGIVVSLFGQVASQNPMLGNVLRIILSGQSGGFDPRQIMGMVPAGMAPQVERVISQFDPRTGRPTDVPQRRGQSSGRINYENQGAVRSLALSDRLERLLRQTAEEVGLDVHIVSGGQMSMEAYQNARGTKRNTGGSSPTYYLNGRAVRKGSVRHDNGNAADLYLTDGSQRIPLDDPRMNLFVETFFRNGGAGGSGDRDYMGEYNIHLDIVGTSAGGTRSWNASTQFLAAMNRGLAQQGTA